MALIISNMDIGWVIAFVVVIVGVLLVIGGVLVTYFGSASRKVSEKKDWSTALRREEIRIAKELDEARSKAARVGRNASALEREALAFFAGPPDLLETFLYLTDHVSIGFEWDPLEDPIQWKPGDRLTRKEVTLVATLRVLRDKDYIGGVLPAGEGGYSIFASNEAIAVRSVWNRLPETLKAKVREEHHRS